MGDHVFISENIILLCVLLMLSVCIGQILDKLNLTWMPASGSQIILGFCVGLAVSTISPEESSFLWFKSDLFFFGLLPMIVFEAGYSMKRTNFFKNVGSIMLFAFVGTAVSTFVIGFGLHFLAQLDVVDIYADDVLDPLTFGALISSIDPIATLAILGNKQLRCDPLLYALVFGESMLNDAVAITLFQTFISFRTADNFDRSDIWAAMGSFLVVAFGSVVIGMVVAMACSFLLRKVNFSRKPSNEFIIIFFSAYMCYSLAELAELSGIMALFICGVGQAHYAWYNISSVSRTTTRHAFHAFAHIAETFLYVYFGISAYFSTQSSFNFQWSWTLILWATLLCLLARALNVFPLSFLANLGRKKKISKKIQIVLWFAGLRGAVSFALVLSMDSPLPGADKYITTTMVIIVLTTLGMGGSSNWLLSALGLTGVAEEEEEHPDNVVVQDVTGDSSGINYEQLDRPVAVHRRLFHIDVRRLWNSFDRQYIMKHVGGRYAPAMEDYSAEHESHGADNTQMTSPYIMAEVQQRPKDRSGAESPSPREEDDIRSTLDGIEITETGARGSVLDEDEEAVLE